MDHPSHPLLTARDWLTKYSPEQCDLVSGFYVPALECAVRYDRSTGYLTQYTDTMDFLRGRIAEALGARA